MRFKKALFSTMMLFSLAVGYIAYYNFRIFPRDIEKYEQLLEDQKGSSTQEDKETTQTRFNTQKDVWQQDKDARLHYRINAEQSTLHLRPKGKKIEMFEEMHNISCLLQEKLYVQQQEKMQELRAFTASYGTYDFSKHTFLAEKVLLDFYTAKGHELPKSKEIATPFLKGLAKQVSFSFSSDGPAFHAEKFRAEMQNTGRIK